MNDAITHMNTQIYANRFTEMQWNSDELQKVKRGPNPAHINPANSDTAV